MKTRTFTLIVTLLALAAGTTVFAHMAYSKSLPEKDAVLSGSPDRVQVWFTQAPDPAVSQLRLNGPSGEVTLGESTVGDENSIVAAVITPLGPGGYTLSWRSAGDDGHVQRGDVAFTIRAAD